MTIHSSQKSSIDIINPDRRKFLVGMTAAGFAFSYAPSALAKTAEGTPAAQGFSPTAWYTIGKDGKVVVTVGKADMGQHIASTMAQLVAEELEASWKDMSVVLASNDPKFNDPTLGAAITGGSWSTMMNFDAMCRAGAAGRMTLISGGAAMLGAPEGECMANASHVIHCKTGKSVSYADIVKSGKANKVWTPDELKAIKLKTRDQYKLIGHSVPQLDIPNKTKGAAKYGIDTMIPGKLYAKPVIPPVRYGASVKSFDDAEAKKVKGFVKAVVIEDPTKSITGWMVVVADTYEGARKAAAALKVDYDKGPNANVSDETILAEARKLSGDPAPGRCSSRTATPRRRWQARRRCWTRNTPPRSTSIARWSR